MKLGRTNETGSFTLVGLLGELDRQAASKKDYVADTRKLSLRTGDNAERGVYLDGVNGGMALKTMAHTQLANVLGIPKTYYDRMLTEQPDLLCKNVNRWFEAQPAKKLIRTLDNQVRAVLSDSYRPLDNFDLAMAVLPKLKELGCNVVSGEVTENRFYLKAVTNKVQGVVGKIKPGVHQFLKPGDDDLIQAGVVISNSEVGQGRLRIDEMDYRLACYNGLIRESVVRKTHVGRSSSRGQDALEDAREFFRDETRIADDRAFFLKAQDAVAMVFNQDRFNGRIAQYAELGAREMGAAKIEEVVEVTAKRWGLNDGERSSVLRNLIQAGDLSQWGLTNAITLASQAKEVSYDRATELEALGGQIVELSRNDWDKLVKVN